MSTENAASPNPVEDPNNARHITVGDAVRSAKRHCAYHDWAAIFGHVRTAPADPAPDTQYAGSLSGTPTAVRIAQLQEQIDNLVKDVTSIVVRADDADENLATLRQSINDTNDMMERWDTDRRREIERLRNRIADEENSRIQAFNALGNRCDNLRDMLHDADVRMRADGPEAIAKAVDIAVGKAVAATYKRLDDKIAFMDRAVSSNNAEFIKRVGHIRSGLIERIDAVATKAGENEDQLYDLIKRTSAAVDALAAWKVGADRRIADMDGGFHALDDAFHAVVRDHRERIEKLETATKPEPAVVTDAMVDAYWAASGHLSPLNSAYRDDVRKGLAAAARVKP